MLVAADSNVFDRKTPERAALIESFVALLGSGRIGLFRGTGVEAEIAHPAARIAAARLPPAAVRPTARPLTAAEHIARMRVRSIVQGNAKPGKHEADAAHLSEAAEAGCRYFLTYDGRFLRRRDDLHRFALPSGLRVATLDEFIETEFPERP